MSHDRERQAIAMVACPTCHSPAGQPCRDVATGRPITPRGRPYVHPERRRAWQQARQQADPLDADLLMTDYVEGPPGARTGHGIVLAPLTTRGRAAVPELRRVPAAEVRATLARLRQRGLVIRRES